MNIKEVNTKVGFTKEKTLDESTRYVGRTLRDASKMNINLTWGFDEAQGGGFHRNWTGEEFLQCIENILEEHDEKI
jgi:hypothetical protein